MVIWKSVPVIIKEKMQHIRKIGGKLYNSFILDYGDIPVARWNEETKQFEEVDNPRGKAYAARRRLKHRPKKKYRRNKKW